MSGLSHSAFRRNVINRSVNLNSLIGREFSVHRVRFLGTGECKPCCWMNSAFHPDAEAALQGNGGLRAKILTTGKLRCRASAEVSGLRYRPGKQPGHSERGT